MSSLNDDAMMSHNKARRNKNRGQCENHRRIVNRIDENQIKFTINQPIEKERETTGFADPIYFACNVKGVRLIYIDGLVGSYDKDCSQFSRTVAI